MTEQFDLTDNQRETQRLARQLRAAADAPRKTVPRATTTRSSSRRSDEPMNSAIIVKRFEQPDEVSEFPLGKFEVVRLGGMTVGRATYQPGWRWADHVGAALGQTSCQVEHVGMVISGRATADMDDGAVIEMRAGDVFCIPPGHDSRVVGDEPYVSLHFLGADNYAHD